MDPIIGLDFETYSFTDLIVHGLDNYMHDEYFTPLIACTHGPEVGQRQRFDFIADYNGARSALIEALSDHAIAAHNAGFEQAVLEQMGIELNRASVHRHRSACPCCWCSGQARGCCTPAAGY